jgi:predicted DNA-binding transcriptional regulator YafY
MRADRLLSMLMLLQTQGRMTARELAAELDVSERTIYRDITALGTAGVPVCAERGLGGGISLVEQYRSDLTGLNKDEVQALFMLSIPTALSDLGRDQELKAALLKLSAALPSTLKDDQQRVRQRIYIDPHPRVQAKAGGALPHLSIVQQAVWEDRVIELTYRSVMGDWVGPLESRIYPYGLVARGGHWYLVGKRRDHVAVVRVDYILDARLTSEFCVRPDDFELITFWESWCVQEASNRSYFPVLVRLSPQLISVLPNLFGEEIQQNLDEAGEPDSMGWITLELPFEFHEQALARLLPLGGSIEVLEPIALRCSVKDYAEQILAVYSSNN